MPVKVTNNAWDVLAAGISDSALSLSLTAGQGARFPSLSGGQWFWLTLIGASNNREIVKVTATSGDTFTIVRAQDGTAARAWLISDRVELRPTAALFNDKLDTDTAASTCATLAGFSTLNASNLTSGTVPDARFPATLPAASGVNLTALNASNLGSGTVPSARVAGAYTGITSVGTLSSLASSGSITISAEWFRSTGNYGWYNNTYGGGIYMIDTTYVRTYGGKDFYCDANILAGGNVTAYSDKRWKDNIEEIPDALAKVNKIRGVTYNRTDLFGAPRHTGVIAQEILEVLPEVVEQDVTGFYSVAYGNIVGLLIQAIKELDAKVEKLSKKKETK